MQRNFAKTLSRLEGDANADKDKWMNVQSFDLTDRSEQK